MSVDTSVILGPIKVDGENCRMSSDLQQPADRQTGRQAGQAGQAGQTDRQTGAHMHLHANYWAKRLRGAGESSAGKSPDCSSRGPREFNSQNIQGDSQPFIIPASGNHSLSWLLPIPGTHPHILNVLRNFYVSLFSDTEVTNTPRTNKNIQVVEKKKRKRRKTTE